MLKRILCKFPILSTSGYGVHSRYIYDSLSSYIKKNDLPIDLFVIPTQWGQTGQISMNSEKFKEYSEVIQKTQEDIFKKETNFDMSVQVTIPNEFELMAPINIGVTAGIESDRVAPLWIQKCNMMTRIIVPSTYSAQGFGCSYDYIDPNTQQKKELRMTTPIFVVPYADECSEWHDKNFDSLIDLPTKFNFLCCAQIGPRKNVDMIVRGFIQEFASRDDVGLVLKISMKNNCKIDKHYCKKQVHDLIHNMKRELEFEPKCKVYLIHGDMTDEEMYGLYCHPKIKAFIGLSTGEGFGLNYWSAALAGLPIIAPAYSGYMDFLRQNEKNMFAEVKYKVAPVQKEAVWENVIIPESQWCFPDYNDYRNALKEVFRKYNPHKETAKELSDILRKKYNKEEMYDHCAKILLAPLMNDEVKLPEEEIRLIG